MQYRRYRYLLFKGQFNEISARYSAVLGYQSLRTEYQNASVLRNRVEQKYVKCFKNEIKFFCSFAVLTWTEPVGTVLFGPLFCIFTLV